MVTRVSVVNTLNALYPNRSFQITPDLQNIQTPYVVVSRLSDEPVYTFGLDIGLHDSAFQVDLYTSSTDISQDIDVISTDISTKLLDDLSLRQIGGSGIDIWDKQISLIRTTLRYGVLDV